MARPRMITRTIITTTANVLMVNINTNEVFEKEVTLSGEFDNTEDVEKKAAKSFNSAESKVIAVKAFTKNESLYGMDEQKFIELAKIIPPRDNTENKSDADSTATQDAPKVAKHKK